MYPEHHTPPVRITPQRPNTERMPTDRIELETDLLPLVVLVPAGMASLATSAASGVGALQVVGIGVFLGGLGVWLWSVLELRRGGSSSAVPTGVLIETGPYRYSRNPMYVGVVVAVVGQGVAFESLLGLAVAPIVWALFRQMVVAYEEPLMRRRLGDPFEEYCQRVPRWLPPFG